ncbi:hypothetical protein [Elizabethkingia meningoseptica]|uniref:hypothetical protein n=1 Tax=Elizabethkingia meningoseptica TaxID=238 RepID=UPI0023B1D029|nr:hypothetical protein [Elizabethkingia meningoseptica]MDE5501700.1 hypothetical protein [Elizabethkingia meningoseptica]
MQIISSGRRSNKNNLRKQFQQEKYKIEQDYELLLSANKNSIQQIFLKAKLKTKLLAIKIKYFGYQNLY